MTSKSNSTAKLRIPRNVWILGVVSLLMDMSSEAIHSLLPYLLTTVLGAPASVFGLVEGIAEATANFTKLASGTLSDRWRNRKWLAVFGYGLSALTKPLFAWAPAIGWIVFARFSDRVGKGIRGAPRDALIADVTPPELRGASYGLRQSLDTCGATLGPLLAIGLMYALANDVRAVLWLAAIPALAAVAVIAFGVTEPDSPKPVAAPKKFTLAGVTKLPKSLWTIIAIACVINLARFSEGFLVLRSQSIGVTPSLLPLTLIVMSAAFTASAYPCGKLADKTTPTTLLFWGCLTLACADAVLGFAATLPAHYLGMALWGLHMGLTHGVLASLIAHHAPSDARGTAFGWYYVTTGIATLLASTWAGLLWEHVNASTTFFGGVFLSVVAAIIVWRAPIGVRSRHSD